MWRLENTWTRSWRRRFWRRLNEPPLKKNSTHCSSPFLVHWILNEPKRRTWTRSRRRFWYWMNQKIFGTMKQKKLNTLKDIFSLHNGLKYILKEPPFIFKHTYYVFSLKFLWSTNYYNVKCKLSRSILWKCRGIKVA